MVDGPLITVYTRRGCHLCADAERLVSEVVAGRAEIRHVDVDRDPVLCERYTVRVPVVEIDGVEVAELMVDRVAIEQALAAFSGS